MSRLFYNKIFFFIIIIINIGLPVNNLLLFSVFSLSLISIIFNQLNAIPKKFFIYIIILFFLSIINIFVLKKEKIEEAHSSFITTTDLKMISEFLPNKLIKIMSDDLLKNFDYDRYFEGRQAPADDRLFIKQPYAFSADSFFQNNKYSREIYNIDVQNRANHRIGQFNTRPFAMPYDQDLKENFPFYVLYKLNNTYENSKICGKGKIFSAFSNDENIQNLDFRVLPNNSGCIDLIGNNNFYIFAYSIGSFDNFELKLENNTKIEYIKYAKLFLIFVILLIILTKFISLKFHNIFLLSIICFFSSFLLAYFNDPNIIYGLRHVYGGSDGLIFSSFASSIVEYIKNGEYILALKGEENIFYFQPGMRYYNALFNIIFGERNFGYILLVSFFPLLLFLLIKNFTNKKIAYFLFFSFIFFPIFESMGFGHFNYVRQAVRLHAESLSIMFIILSIYLIIKINDDKKRSNIYLICTGLLISQILFLRPNFLPTCLILSIFVLFTNIINKQFFYKNVLFICSLIPSFLCLFHNYYFGNELVLFSSASRHLLFSKDFMEFNFTEANNFLHLLVIQLRDWNDFVYFPRLLILLYVIYYIKLYKLNDLIFVLIICCISQHIVLLLTHASSRYAYLAWLLTFILFIKIMYDNDHLLKLKNFLKRRKN